jgi:hypothetical protein
METDGSLKIAVEPKPVSGVPEANWLPSAEGKPFLADFPRLRAERGRAEVRMDTAGAGEDQLNKPSEGSRW